MKPDTSSPVAFQAGCSRRYALFTIAGALAHLSGCGGGGSGFAGLSSGGTGSFTSGTVAGFGSVIVNGIRFNNDAAQVYANGTASSNTALKVGMVATIEGSSVTPATTTTGLPAATATKITVNSEWIGPVSNISNVTGAQRFEVLGHVVSIIANTVFAGAAQDLNTLNTSHFVEVYGYLDQVTGTLLASRIDVSSTPPTQYKLSGLISNIGVNQTANIGPTPIFWNTASVLPANMGNGSRVRVWLDTSAIGSAWLATQIVSLDSHISGLQDGERYEAEIIGNVTAYYSDTDFSVNNIPVDASSVQPVVSLAMGMSVEVKGIIQSGRLSATQVQIEDASTLGALEYEFYGDISNVTSTTFDVHAMTFSYDGTTLFTGFDIHLNPTAYVEVKARPSNGGWYAYEVVLEV